jgi:hypothetical protein
MLIDMHEDMDVTEESGGSGCSDVNNIDVMQLAATFICEAKSCISMLSTVQHIVKACQNLIGTLMDAFTDDL